MDEIDQHLAQIKARWQPVADGVTDNAAAIQRRLSNPEAVMDIDWLIECVEIERRTVQLLSEKLDGPPV